MSEEQVAMGSRNIAHRGSLHAWLAAAALFAFLMIFTEGEALAGAEGDPPFSDTAGTVFDIIQKGDPTAFVCLDASGRGERQIWDKRVDGEPVVNAYLFHARFSDGTNIEVAVNPEFGSREAAEKEASRYTAALGQLPTSLRRGINRVSVHEGRKSFHAGTGQIVFYAGTATERESYNHLEESIFHEAVHASWDAEHRLVPAWLKAQRDDGGFLTSYASRSPDREDLSETALFAFAILYHPDRLPPADTEATLKAVPNRIAYIRGLLPPDKPLFVDDGPPQGCAAKSVD